MVHWVGEGCVRLEGTWWAILALNYDTMINKAKSITKSRKSSKPYPILALTETTACQTETLAKQLFISLTVKSLHSFLPVNHIFMFPTTSPLDCWTYISVKYYASQQGHFPPACQKAFIYQFWQHIRQHGWKSGNLTKPWTGKLPDQPFQNIDLPWLDYASIRLTWH